MRLSVHVGNFLSGRNVIFLLLLLHLIIMNFKEILKLNSKVVLVRNYDY